MGGGSSARRDAASTDARQARKLARAFAGNESPSPSAPVFSFPLKSVSRSTPSWMWTVIGAGLPSLR